MSWNKFNVNIKYPCKGCMERKTACWDTYERYKAVRAEYDKCKERADAERDASLYTSFEVRKNRDKTVKRKKEQWRRRRYYDHDADVIYIYKE